MLLYEKSSRMENRESQEALGNSYHHSPAVRPEDILYAGSDTEETPEEVARKRLRYEHHAEQIAVGRLPILLSATLRGPLSKESGWVNPWRYITQPKKNSSWWDPGLGNMLFTREKVLQRAASHGLGYMKPSEALAWCKATAEAEATQISQQDLQGDVLNSVETDDQENQEDMFDQPPENDNSMLPIGPTAFHYQIDKTKLMRPHDPPDVFMGLNDLPTAIKRTADSRWLKGSHISKRAKWDGLAISSPTPLPTTFEEKSHKRIDEAIKATNSRNLIKSPIKLPRSQRTSQELTTDIISEKSNNTMAPHISRYSNSETPVNTRDHGHLSHHRTHHEALSLSRTEEERLPSYLKSSSKPTRRPSMKRPPGRGRREPDPSDLQGDLPTFQPSIGQHSNPASQRLPELRSPVSNGESCGRVSPNIDEHSFVTEVAPSSRDLEKFKYKKRTRKSHTESNRDKIVTSKAVDEEMLYGVESAGPPQQDEPPYQDDLMQKDGQEANRAAPPLLSPQRTSLTRTHPYTEIYSVEPDVDVSESEANDISWAILEANAQTLLNLETSNISPSASSSIVTAHQLSLAAASPFHLTFPSHQSPETHGSLRSSKGRQLPNSPHKLHQLSENRHVSVDELYTDYLSGEDLDVESEEIDTSKFPRTSSGSRISRQYPVRSTSPRALYPVLGGGPPSMERLENKDMKCHGSDDGEPELPKIMSSKAPRTSSDYRGLQQHRMYLLSPQNPQQIYKDRDSTSEEPNQPSDGEITDDSASELHYGIPDKLNESEQVPERVLLAERSSSQIFVVAANQQESSGKVVHHISQDLMDISTQSFNTTPTMSRRIPLPSFAKTPKVLLAESPSEEARKQIMDEIQTAPSQECQSLHSQEGPVTQSSQSSDSASDLDEQRVHAMAMTIGGRINSVTCSPTTAPQAEEDISDYENVKSFPENAVDLELILQSSSSYTSGHSSPPPLQSPFIIVDAQSPFAPEVDAESLEIESKPSSAPSSPKKSFVSNPQREASHDAEPDASHVLPGVEVFLATTQTPHENRLKKLQIEAMTSSCTPQSPFPASMRYATDLQVELRSTSPSSKTQSPWAVSHIPLTTSLLRTSSPSGELSQETFRFEDVTSSSPHPLPKLDWDLQARPETPEYGNIRPFSDFMSPTPSPNHDTTLFDAGPLNTQVLLEAATKNPWRSNLKKTRSRESGKRVSFSILPNEDTPSQRPISQTRLGSPPPQANKSVGIDYDDDTSPSPMKRSRLYGVTKNIPRLVSKNDDPTFSSPAFGAQAEAFIAADHELAIQEQSRMTLVHSPTRHLMQRTSAMDNIPRARGLFDEYGFDRVSQNKANDRSLDFATFDLDDALGEAEDFLEDWSVDTELKRAKSSENGRTGKKEKKGNGMGSTVERNRLFKLL